MKRIYLSLAALSFCTLVGNAQKTVGTLTQPLEQSAWQQSAWLSAADAKVITGKVYDGTRAADGASWFVSTLQCSKKVKSARWMTTGLGTYELYVNGKLMGEEVLKPGFTHYEKT